MVNSRNEKVAEGHTPGKIKLKAADSETLAVARYYVVFTAPGKATSVNVVDYEISPLQYRWYGTGPLGMYIDYKTGARFRLKNVLVQMTPAQFPNQVHPDLMSREDKK